MQENQISISISTFCNMVGLGRTKTYELINDGTLDTIKIGRRRLIKMSSVLAFVEIFTSEIGEEQ